jgi:RHS repeat-associated protein
MNRVPHIQRSPDKPKQGPQPPLPELGLTGRPAPLLLEEKGLGDEVDATKERPEDDSLSLSVSIEEKKWRIGLSGGGMANAPLDPLTFYLDHLSDHDNYAGITSGLQEMMLRNTSCVGFNSSYLSMDPHLHSIEQSTHHSDPEPNWYIYHSDHLGSSAFLTDASGDPTQHLQYMPFGETFVEQRSITSYYTPYTFSAKERDLETGYSYFGARYYDADISVWLSVDPMADKYPYQSGYCYVGLRPIMVIDPNGMWEWDADGNLVAQKGDQSYSLAKFLGTNQKNAMTILNRCGVTANDKGILNLKEGQVLSKENLYIDKEVTSSVTVNNTVEATQHYLNGKGETADVGNASTNEMLQSEEFRTKHHRITSISDIDPDGFFAVDMTRSTFHIGKTQVKYDISQNGSTSSVKYGLFYSNIWGSDGFWDVDIIDANILGRIPLIRDWTKTTPDGPGTNLERLGGTPYHYELRERTYFFMPPR